VHDIYIVLATGLGSLPAVWVWTATTGPLGDFIYKAKSATTLVSFRNTQVFRMALTALTEPRTLWRRITCFLLPRRRVVLHSITKTYFSHWEPPGVSERMWSVNLDASISGEYQTLGGHSCRSSEELGAPTTSLGAPGSAGDMSGCTSNHSHVFGLYSHLRIYVSI